jgi:hypothetical protein
MTTGDSSTDRAAIEWLERFQLKEYQRLGIRAPATLTPDALFELVAKADLSAAERRFLNETIRNPDSQPVGSRLDSPVFRAAVAGLGSELGNIFLPEARITPPIFGSFPSSTPNARAIFHKSSGRHIVVLHDGLFHFFRLATLALAHVCPAAEVLEDPRHDFNLSDRVDLLFQAFPWVLEAVLGCATGKMAEAQQIAKNVCGSDYVSDTGDEGRTRLSLELRSSILAFVVGHEFGHIVAREKPLFYSADEFFDDNVDAVNRNAMSYMFRSLTSEFEADAIGIDLAVRRGAKRGLSAVLSYTGIIAFFDLMLLFDRCVQMFRDGKIAEDNSISGITHPPLITRRQQVEACISRINGDPLDTEKGKRAAAICKLTTEAFWIKAKPMFKQLHEKGFSRDLVPELVERQTSQDER